jgi:hypothetical protein
LAALTQVSGWWQHVRCTVSERGVGMRKWLPVAAATIALGLIASAGAVSASPGASAARLTRSCPAYKETIKKKLYGETWLIHSRIGLIMARGISCEASRSLIRKVDVREPPMPLFKYVPVGRWQCKIPLRPYGGPHYKTGLDCKRPGRHLAWEETLLWSKRTG